jgi:hypothetical protein
MYCDYCGKKFILDGVNDTIQVTDHVYSCEDHPMRRVEAQRRILLDACRDMVPLLQGIYPIEYKLMKATIKIVEDSMGESKLLQATSTPAY